MTRVGQYRQSPGWVQYLDQQREYLLLSFADVHALFPTWLCQLETAPVFFSVVATIRV